MTNQDQREQQAETWLRTNEDVARHDLTYIPVMTRAGELVAYAVSKDVADTIIANHQAQQQLQELEAETQVQLIEAEQRIVQAQEELVALRAERDGYREQRDANRREITRLALKADRDKSAAETQLATAVAALEEYGDHRVQCYDANQHADSNGEYPGCTCGFSAALAALKGGS